MKFLITPILAILLIDSAASQAQFPLHKGNLWQYEITELGSSDPWSATILGDTLLPNGKTYSIYLSRGSISSFWRQSASKVFLYSPSDSTERVLFDFAANPGDTVSIRKSNAIISTIILLASGLDTASGLNWWWFVERHGGPGQSYEYRMWQLLDSLGITYLWGEPSIAWKLTGAKINGVVKYGQITTVYEVVPPPHQPVLSDPFPNPFNPSTTIRFYLPQTQDVSLMVFDPLGRQVAILINGKLSAGEHSFSWNAGKLPSGIYFYSIKSAEFVETKKLVLLK